MIGRSERTLALALAGVMTLSGTAGAQEEEAVAPDAAQSELTLSAPISVLVAGQLGNDPEAIFRFVADHVRFEPYSGLLRGAAATYFGRAGNSVDQSLLLARLLEAIDVETRLAVGAIDDETAERLLEAAILDAAGLDEQRTMAWSGQLPGYTSAPEVPSIATYLPAYDGATQTELVDDWVRAEVGDTLALLEQALGSADITLPEAYSALPPDELEMHTWVQAEIDGQWVDLDPSLPGVAFGESLAEPEETMTEVPEERTHWLEVSVTAEKLREGALEEEQLLQLTMPAWDAADEPIVLAHVGPDADPALAQRFEAVLGLTTRHPILVIGDEIHAGDALTFADPEAADGGGLGGGFFDASDSLEETTAEWVEISIVSPGADVNTVRRTVFDRVPAAARAAAEVSADTLLPSGAVDADGDGTPELDPDLWVTWLTVATGHPSPLAGVLDLAADDERLPTIVPWTQQMVAHLAEGSSVVPFGVDAFIDAPNVTAVTGTVRPDTDGDPLAETAIDVIHRSHGVLPIRDVEAVGVPAAIPGILANVAERLVGGEAFEAIPPHRSINVNRVFEEALADGEAIVIVADDADVDALPYAADAKSTLRSSLADGLIAVAPTRPVEIEGAERVGWWLVDPASGRVVDQLDDGRGVEVFGYELSGLEVGVLVILGTIGAFAILAELVDLYYNPPEMQGPGEGFSAVQQFFGWGN